MKNIGWKRYAVLFALIYFAQGMSGNPGIFIVSLQFLLKEELLLTAAQLANFSAWMILAWNIKPIYGLLSDFVPIFGYRRKSYLMLTSFLAFLAIIAVTLLSKLSFWSLLIPLMVCSLGLAFSDVLCDALMVEKGQLFNAIDKFQSIQWLAGSFASILVGAVGGYLATYYNYKTAFLIAAIFPFLVFWLSLIFVKEEKRKIDLENLKLTISVTKLAFKDKNLWIIAGFLFFWKFSPSFGAPLLYYQRDVLKFSKFFIGSLDTITSIGFIIGALIYWKFCQKISLKTLLNWIIGFGVIGALAYLGLVGPKSAIALNLVFGVTGMIALLTVLSLAAKSCPPKIEGTIFAFLMSSLNLGGTGSQFIGGKLFELVGLNTLIIISAVFTALCWLFIPYLKIKQN